MDPLLHQLMQREIPHVNPDIGNGLAVKHIPMVEKYIDSVMHSAAKGFPEGLEYLGCERCTPLEEFNYVSKKKNGRRSVDVARSDIYLMKYHFKFKGVDLPPRYLYLPYVSDGGTMTISGSRYAVSPVLSDKIISPGLSNIFVRLLRDKLTFERQPYAIIIDNINETSQVIWSMIYHKPQSLKTLKATVKMNCALMHYLLCKYGFTETFKRYGGATPVIGEREINDTNYPNTDWVICRSTQVKPKGFGKGFYQATEIRVAIRKEEFTPLVKSMITGFFYIVDHFPSRIMPTYVDNTRLWSILLGHILFSGSINEGTLYTDISKHFKSLDEYIDIIIAVKLKEIGYECNDIYHLFAIIIQNFNEWILDANEKVSSLYGKELSILYHVLYDITSAIFNLNFKLKSASKKEITDKEIISTMNMVLKTGLIFSITRQHVNMSTVSYSGDNKFFKITCIMVPQTSSNRMTAKKTRASISDPAKRLHVSVAEVGGYSNLPKSDPTGHARINPHLKIDDKGSVLQDPAKIPLLSQVEEMIRRR